MKVVGGIGSLFKFLLARLQEECGTFHFLKQTEAQIPYPDLDTSSCAQADPPYGCCWIWTTIILKRMLSMCTGLGPFPTQPLVPCAFRLRY